MYPAILPPVQEVKYKEFTTATNFQPATNGWAFLNTTLLSTIIQGTGPNDRIGRNIRVVGVVVRALVNTDITGFFSPSSMDLVWDNQFNGILPGVSEIYNSTLPPNVATATGHSLPNPLFDQRFKFAKRVQIKNPNSALNLVDFNYTCNKIIEYKASTLTGAITDLSASNIYLTFCSPGDSAPQIDYSLRILYVDA